MSLFAKRKKLLVGVYSPDWLHRNLAASPDDERSGLIAPFPPPDLMQVVSGLTNNHDFAARGVALYRAVQDASPKPLTEFTSILDFGCGSGCLDRMFLGHRHQLVGCDVDHRLVDWVNGNLPFMTAVTTTPNGALPFKPGQFDCVISISVFTHLSEESQRFYLAELQRCTKPGALLFLTIHGSRAMERATNEESIFQMISISTEQLDQARTAMAAGTYAFAVQPSGHLTSDGYEYGISFTPESYVQQVWSEYFDVVQIESGAIHDWQSIVVCRAR
jgi:SAM-dependent methyltransferase